MPILAREPDTYPADLLDSPRLDAAHEVGWWAAYTIARREKTLMRLLAARRISFHTPMVPRRSVSRSGRIRTAWVPLFTNYVFLYGTEVERRTALTTNCISRCFSAPDSAALANDFRRIRRLIASGAAVTAEARIEAGTPVRVRTGVMAGLEGVVVRRERRTRLLIAVDFIQQGASVLVEDFEVEEI